MYPDFYNARIDGRPAHGGHSTITPGWRANSSRTVQQRGAAIIKARGASSAASAANAVVDTVRALTTRTPEGEWHSVSVCSPGEYDVPAGLICSFPVRTLNNGSWELAKWVPLNEFSREKIAASIAELSDEKAMVSELLK